MTEDKYGVVKRLMDNHILDQSRNTLNEPAFLEFLFGLFLFYLGFERYKKIFDDAIETQRRDIIRGEKPHPFALPAFPFRFVGIGNKTIFIGKMGKPNELFADILQNNFFWNYNHIDRTEPFIDSIIIQQESWKKHSCDKNYLNKYCQNCKLDFSILASAYFSKFSKSFNIDGYLTLDIPATIFAEIISQEGLVELEQHQTLCFCESVLEKEWGFCPFCGNKIDVSVFEKNNDSMDEPEKIFNYTLGLYLSIKKGYDFKANFVMDKDFNNETDIYLQKKDSIKLIEYTTKLNLDKSYVVSKVKTLNLVESSLKAEALRIGSGAPSCSLILLGINKPENKPLLDSIPLKIFEDPNKFKIIDSKFKFKKTNVIQITQEELDSLKAVFLGTLNELLSYL
ncbi:MAG: hypothetical protein AABY10_03505 [Nanoarchaeota archaeon]